MTRLRLLPLFLMGVLLGCGGDPKPTLIPVKGVVTLNDAPLPGVTVEFIPVSPSGGTPIVSSGVSDAQGNYTVSHNDSPGAVAGKHKVVVRRTNAPVEDRDAPPKADTTPKFPTTYSNLSSTPIEVSVDAATADYPIRVKR